MKLAPPLFLPLSSSSSSPSVDPSLPTAFPSSSSLLRGFFRSCHHSQCATALTHLLSKAGRHTREVLLQLLCFFVKDGIGACSGRFVEGRKCRCADADNGTGFWLRRCKCSPEDAGAATRVPHPRHLLRVYSTEAKRCNRGFLL
jgi:hypothetical protein